MTSIENILKMLNDPAAQNEASEPKPMPEKKSSETEKKTEINDHPDSGNITDISNKEEVWRRLLEKIDSEDHLLSCKLAEAKLIKLTDSELSIGFNGGMSVLADSIRSKSSVIQPILQKISGQNLRLKILSLPKKEPQKDNEKIKEEVFAEPLVKDAIKRFDGSLLRVKSLEENEEIK